MLHPAFSYAERDGLLTVHATQARTAWAQEVPFHFQAQESDLSLLSISTSSASFVQADRFLFQVLVRLQQVAAGTRQVMGGIDRRLFAIEASTEFIFAAGIPRRTRHFTSQVPRLGFQQSS